MKIFKKEVDKDKLLYGGLILTFAILYIATAFVSWYHAITFFNIANAVWLSVILSFVAEIGQASALFSILLTKNSSKFLTWSVMVILTTLQVIGNVVSSYDWIINHNRAGVESFQKSILFWMNTADPEIFKVVIAWISGALLPIIALSMTALVAQNFELQTKGESTVLDEEKEKSEPVDPKDFISEVVKIHPTEDQLKELEAFLNSKKPIEKVPPEVEINPNDFLGRTEEEIKHNDDLIKEEKKTSIIASESPSIEITEDPKVEITNMVDDVPPPEEITNEEAELSVLPHYSDEEIYDMNLDEHERIDTSDDLDEEVARLIPEVQTGSGDPVGEKGREGWAGSDNPNDVPDHMKAVSDPVGPTGIEGLPISEVIHRNGLVELITTKPDIVPEPSPTTTSEDEEKKRLEEERLEKLRAIARENLKKK
jgi:hypothetical protein